MDDTETAVSRRGFIRLATGATAVTGSVGAVTAQNNGTGNGGGNATGGGTGNGTGGDTGNATGGTGNQTGNETGNATGGGSGNESGDGAGNATGNASGQGGGGGATQTVAMTDDLVFDPDEITVAPGDTIVWENVGSTGHSVTAYAEEIPGDATYFASGGFESEEAARSEYAPGDPDSGDIGEGETYEHTFEVVGDYEYFCIPHESAGMVGTVTVSEGGGQAAEGGAAAAPQVPDVARTFAIALTGGMLAILSLVYVFIKFGGDYSFEGSEENR